MYRGGFFKTKKMKRKEIKGYKGFDRNLKCRGWQYKVGGTSVFDGKIKVGFSGFHFYEFPTDVFDIYPPNKIGRYAKINSKGKIDRDSSYSAYCTDKLEVTEELSVEEMYKQECNNIRIVRLDSVSVGSSWRSLTEREDDFAVCLSALRKSMSLTTGRASSAITCDRGSYAKTTGAYSTSIALRRQSLAEANGDRSIAVAAKDETSAKVTGKASIAFSRGVNTKVYVSAGSVGVLYEHQSSEFVGELGAIAVVLLMDERRNEYVDAKTFIVDGETVLPNHIYTFENGVPSDKGVFREDYKK